MDTTYQPPNRMHRPFTCGDEAKARALLGLTSGWAQEYTAAQGEKPRTVVVQLRDRERAVDVPGRLRGPVFGRAAR